LLALREGPREDWLYFVDPHGRAASIPRRFTDWQPADPVQVLGQGCCPFRVADLLVLAKLLEDWRV
jgi:hypothetical protein